VGVSPVIKVGVSTVIAVGASAPVAAGGVSVATAGAGVGVSAVPPHALNIMPSTTMSDTIMNPSLEDFIVRNYPPYLIVAYLFSQPAFVPGATLPYQSQT